MEDIVIEINFLEVLPEPELEELEELPLFPSSSLEPLELLWKGMGDGIGVGIGDGNSLIGDKHFPKYPKFGTSNVMVGVALVPIA